MKKEKEAAAVLKEAKKGQKTKSLAQLIDAVRRVNRRCTKINIVHRALWNLADEACFNDLPNRQYWELHVILHMLNRHQGLLEKFLDEATKYCDELKQ